MLRRIVVIAAAIITVCADRPQAQPQAQPAGTVAIRAGRVIDNGAVFKRDGLIVIDGLLNPGPVNGWRRR